MALQGDWDFFPFLVPVPQHSFIMSEGIGIIALYNLIRSKMRKIVTPEQKVATKIAHLVSDVTIDLEQVGISIARDNPNVVYRRLQEIAEVAEQEKMSKGQGIIEV